MASRSSRIASTALVYFCVAKVSGFIQIDITSGIDNLMSFNRECAVFVEHP
jgi:hypothetical protein